VVPVEIAVNTLGEISIAAVGAIVTPIGEFGIVGGLPLATLRQLEGIRNKKVLIVRIDNEAKVYELEEGKRFEVFFGGDNAFYRKVALTYDEDGDIILELESVARIGEDYPTPSRIPPEQAIRDYYDLINRYQYEAAWSRLTDRFRSIKNLGKYQTYIQFWQTIRQVIINDLDLIEETTTSAKLMANMTYVTVNSQIDKDPRFYIELLWDSITKQWMFDYTESR
jgi:hypothetical protein